MRAYILGVLIATGILLVAGRTAAHHSFAAEFDGSKPITLTGRVTTIQWTNPHVWVYLNVNSIKRSNDGGKTWEPLDQAGKVTNWGFEMGPPHGLQRRGWRRDTLKIGEELTVVGSLAKNGSNRINARSVTLTTTGGRPGETLDAQSSQRDNP